MATRYVDSGAAGANNGTSWTDAYNSILQTWNSGDLIYLASRHQETFVGNQAITLGSIGATANAVTMVSVTTGTTTYEKMDDDVGLIDSDAQISFAGVGYIYGIKATAGTNIRPIATADSVLGLFDCDMSSGPTNDKVELGGASSYLRAENSRFTATSGTDALATAAESNKARFISCTFNATNLSTGDRLFESSDDACDVIFDSCDFTNCGSPDNYVRYANNAENATVTFRDCQVPAGMTGNDLGTAEADLRSVALHRTGSGTITSTPNDLVLEESNAGTVEQSTTATRLAEDRDGNAYSWKLDSTGNVGHPLSTPWITFPIASTDRVIKVHFGHSATNVNETADLWAELISPNEETTARYLGKFQTKRVYPGQTAASFGAGDDTNWAGTYGGTTSHIEFDILPTENGVGHVRVFLAVAGEVVYVCPLVEVTT